MCGILALLMLRGQAVDPARLRAMRDTMVHRGPDGAGIHIDGPVGLGHRRLSIIDLSPAGHQPMCNEDRTVWLVFNGEIYNYVELAEGLKARGHRFRSRTDSEVILHLWEESGEACVEQLNGMFSFVLWDGRRRELFGARDRAGIKPFHYYADANRVIVASEIKAILADPGVPRRPDYRGLSDLLMAGYPQEGKTCFEGISQLQPGWSLSVRDGQLWTRKYWDVPFDYDHSRSLEQTVGQLGELVADAVRIQCRSDATLGCHLSGGLDSSTIAAMAMPERNPLHTFSIHFPDQPHVDESAYARAVAQHLGTTHHEESPGANELASHLATLAWHADMPMPDISSFSYYCASRLAARHVKVALTGHGGDEIFAGYPAQFAATFGDTSMFERRTTPPPNPGALTHLRLALRRHGILGTARRLLGRAVPPQPLTLEQRWIQLHCGLPPVESPLLRPAFRRQLDGYDPSEAYLAPLRQAATTETLDRCLYHDLRSYLPGLLHQEDRASMALSIESRVPLLDHRIIEFLGSVPPALKVAGGQSKALLRQVLRGRVPDAVVNRRAKGAFEVPMASWFRGPLAPMLQRTVHSATAARRGIFDPVELQSGVHGHRGYWTALSMELWFRLYFDQDREWLDQVVTRSVAASTGDEAQEAAV